jgi:hypothetical protein
MRGSFLILPLLLFGAAGRTRETGSGSGPPPEPRARTVRPQGSASHEEYQPCGPSGACGRVDPQATIPSHGKGSWCLTIRKGLRNAWRRDVEGRRDHRSSSEPDADA